MAIFTFLALLEDMLAAAVAGLTRPRPEHRPPREEPAGGRRWSEEPERGRRWSEEPARGAGGANRKAVEKEAAGGA